MHRAGEQTMLRLNAADRDMVTLVSQAGLQFAADESKPGSRPTVRMTAYTGNAVRTWQFEYPLVVDLAGVKLPSKSRPLLKDHNPGMAVGHTTRVWVENGKSLEVEGVLSGANQTTEELIASGKNGFPWQASIGAPMLRVELIRAGTKVTVNGRSFQGPIYVARETELREISVVALGADDATRTSIAARRQGGSMEFEKWLRANGWDPDTLTDGQRKSLELAYNAERGRNGQPPQNQNPPANPDEDPVRIVRMQAAAETRRCAQITEICEGYPTLCATAIEEGWDPTRAELEVLRQQRPQVRTHTGASRNAAPTFNAQVIEAGLLASMGVSDKDRQGFFNERTLEAARPFEKIGLQELLMLCGRLDKMEMPVIFGDGEETIRLAFSTMSLPGILENVLNKQALLSYQAAEIQALKLCRIASTRDFKQVSRVRMLGSGKYEKVSKAGELRSGVVGEQKFTNQADTYGQVLFIDRQTVINDDLQILNDAGTEIGYQGAEVINQLFVEALLGAGPFFHADNGNLITGGGSAFSESSLNDANTKFNKQKAGPNSKEKDKRPINIPAEILLVPAELHTKAQILLGSSDVRPGGGNDADREGNFNPWRGRFTLVMMPHLSDTFYSGSSTTAWYLLANPNRVPAAEAVFLNGNRTPRVERVSPPATQLGIGYRGYIDVGISMMDPKGIVKSAGA